MEGAQLSLLDGGWAVTLYWKIQHTNAEKLRSLLQVGHQSRALAWTAREEAEKKMNEDGSEKKKQLYSEQNMPTLCIRFKHFFTVCVEYSKLILGVANQTCLYMILIKMSCHVFRFRLHRTARGKQNPRKRCMKKDRWQNGNFSVFFFRFDLIHRSFSKAVCNCLCKKPHYKMWFTKVLVPLIFYVLACNHWWMPSTLIKSTITSASVNVGRPEVSLAFQTKKRNQWYW